MFICILLRPEPPNHLFGLYFIINPSACLSPTTNPAPALCGRSRANIYAKQSVDFSNLSPDPQFAEHKPSVPPYLICVYIICMCHIAALFNEWLRRAHFPPNLPIFRHRISSRANSPNRHTSCSACRSRRHRVQPFHISPCFEHKRAISIERKVRRVFRLTRRHIITANGILMRSQWHKTCALRSPHSHSKKGCQQCSPQVRGPVSNMRKTFKRLREKCHKLWYRRYLRVAIVVDEVFPYRSDATVSRSPNRANRQRHRGGSG